MLERMVVKNLNFPNLFLRYNLRNFNQILHKSEPFSAVTSNLAIIEQKYLFTCHING